MYLFFDWAPAEGLGRSSAFCTGTLPLSTPVWYYSLPLTFMKYERNLLQGVSMLRRHAPAIVPPSAAPTAAPTGRTRSSEVVRENPRFDGTPEASASKRRISLGWKGNAMYSDAQYPGQDSRSPLGQVLSLSLITGQHVRLHVASAVSLTNRSWTQKYSSINVSPSEGYSGVSSKCHVSHQQKKPYRMSQHNVQKGGQLVAGAVRN